MPLYFHFLVSLSLHLAIVLGPTWFGTRKPDPSTPRIEARLVSDATPPATDLAERVSTEPEPELPAPEPGLAAPPGKSPGPISRPAPKKLEGASLRRAQSALSKHLYYPPEAVKQGLEGEVILLLQLDESGRVRRIEIARSSGHALLDQAAISAAENLGDLPGNPAQTLLPVNFRLE